MSRRDEINEEFDFEYWLDRESVGFKESRGRSGLQLQIRECPVCNDTRYRTYMGMETKRGNCFVCNATFDPVTFVHRYLGHDPDNSRDWGKTYAYIREAMSEQGWRPKRTSTVAVDIDTVKLPTSFALPTGEGRNLEYLEARGITGDLARFFHLRCCVQGRWTFPRDDGTTGFQKFDNRVIIPVFDLDGKLVTFQGRDYTGLVGDKKYLFPSGLPGTGRYLFNGQNAWHAKRLCMGEGAFDVIATKVALDGEPELRDVVPVGSFGKNLSYGDPAGMDQLGALLKLKAAELEEVTIMWDGELKALEAALQAAELITRIGLRARVALLPKGRDPNEVPPAVVREAFKAASVWSPQLAMMWRLRNPYR